MEARKSGTVLLSRETYDEARCLGLDPLMKPHFV